MVTALYPGTFDPITNGHLDIIQRAARLFEEVIVAAYDLPQKNLLFSTEERVDLILKAVASLPNVRVKAYSGLTVDFARKVGAQVMVRGLRAGADFNYEFDMALMNKRMAPQIEAVYMMASHEFVFVSGSRIREVASLGRLVDDLVPQAVAEALKKRFPPSS